MNDHSLHRDHNVTELRGDELFPTMEKWRRTPSPELGSGDSSVYRRRLRVKHTCRIAFGHLLPCQDVNGLTKADAGRTLQRHVSDIPLPGISTI